MTVALALDELLETQRVILSSSYGPYSLLLTKAVCIISTAVFMFQVDVQL